MQTISDILNTSNIKPYYPPLKVILATRSEKITYKKDNVDKEMMYLGICDVTGHIKATLYDLSQIDNFANGSPIMIRNYLVRPDKTIAITSKSQIFRTGQLQVPDSILQQAVCSVRPPTPPPIPLKEVHSSPVKTITSIMGTVTQDELPRQVVVRGEPVAVRTIVMSDKEAKVKVALWRDESKTQIQTGDFLSVTNVMIKNYQGENQLSTTSRTTIKKTDMPPEDVTGQIEGYIEEENYVNLLMASDLIVKIKHALLQEALNAGENEWKQVIDALIPLEATITVHNAEAVKISFQDNPSELLE